MTTSSAEWLARAQEVAAKLAVDAVDSDHEGKTPYEEVQLLKDTGLVTLLGPVEHGGGGET
jgi:alkylation response protein AidB-like acyl-CoA dehydrogenase